MNADCGEIARLLREIISGNDRGERISRQLVTAILDKFPDADDDERLEQLMHILASYKPGGGEFLFGEDDLAEECIRVLNHLCPS